MGIPGQDARRLWGDGDFFLRRRNPEERSARDGPDKFLMTD